MSRTEVAEYLGTRAMALAASVALLLVRCGNAWAASPTETLQGVFAAVNRVLGDPEFQEKPRELMGAIHNVMGVTFDFREAARLAMGREWEARTPTEQDEFVQRSEEHTSELQSHSDLVCRLLLEKKKKQAYKGRDGRRTGAATARRQLQREYYESSRESQ